MNEFVFRSTIERSRRDCQVIENSNTSVIVTCEDVYAARRRMNSADVVMLRQMLAGQVLYMTLLNSHSVAGYEDMSERLEVIHKRQKDEQISPNESWQMTLALFDGAKDFGKAPQRS